MDRGASSHLLTWMLLPVSAVLVISALTLARQPYTGLMLRGDWVAAVDPGSPGERAGLARGDRLIPLADRPRGGDLDHPLASARPGHELRLLRERAGALVEVAVLAAPLPDRERRMMAMLLAVASGFVVLGGWVWSERRDLLTRTFYLSCLAFAWLLAPLPRFETDVARALYEDLYSGVTLFLPALFIHFFAMFPEGLRPTGIRGRVGSIGYGIATALFTIALVLHLVGSLRNGATPFADLLQGVAGLWFAAGWLIALVLFVRSYRRVRTADARRRLRVALIGTVLGAGPLAALVAIHNLQPGTSLPAERWAVVLTLLVPGGFAWATVVHRIFEFRVALRAAIGMTLLAASVASVFFLGEWLSAAWRADLGAGIGGGALALLALVASVAGPARGVIREVGRRMVPEREADSLAEWLVHSPAARRGSLDAILEAACEGLTTRLKLDGCAVVEFSTAGPVPRARVGEMTTPALLPGFASRLEGRAGVLAVADEPLLAEFRRVLDAAGVSWVVPFGGRGASSVLLLGRRLAGAWLGVSEQRELQLFAEQLEVLIENATLRQAASAHGAMDREMTRAGAIQAHLLPRRLPRHASLDCAAGTLSSKAVGGDYYDFVEGHAGQFTLAVGDAAGKGVPAALMGAWVQACFRNQARRGSRPARVLGVLNHELVALEQPDAFVALLCAHVDVPAGRMRLANAGLTPPLLRRGDGSIEEFTEGGVLLGVAARSEYPEVAIQLAAGDIVLLYTDGLTEARRGDEMFGTDRLRGVLTSHAARPAADIVAALLSAVHEFTDEPPDDMTVVVLKQVASAVGARRSARQDGLKWSEQPADALR
ncbi:MAG: SpoIIE family protein phosphatase [Candidatus Eisenbacteria bacterium]|uniref:SpoIIE family protein phosphatase n=1 Tax=Eiseniibacteriota bacterium TaxID=2212470 RepID=A0A849SEF5_UNCEI|nr:SpoIIE family protein phosphatase [Candidatus Eisenbacteria bacterium]